MNKEERGKYMASRPWAVLREKIKKRSGGMCEHCHKLPMDQTHHLTYERFGQEKLEDLLGVCEPCHKFLSGKSEYDPARRHKPRIYFAGKIRKSHDNSGRRCHWNSGKLFFDPIECNEHINIGPFYIGCDHGCFHGEGSHGVGAGRDEVCGTTGLLRQKVFDVCEQQILQCDILAANIDADDAFGTYVEIGIARAAKKCVFVFFDTEERRSRQWFLGKAGIEVVGPRDLAVILAWWHDGTMPQKLNDVVFCRCEEARHPA